LSQSVPPNRFVSGLRGTMPGCRLSAIGLLTLQALIDCRNLFYPAAPLRMFKVQHFLMTPVKVVSDEGYLLIERFQGIA
jgi:hypothetical protein